MSSSTIPTAPGTSSSICKTCNNATWIIPDEITFANFLKKGIACAPDHGPANAYPVYQEVTRRLASARKHLERHIAALGNPWLHLCELAVERSAKLVTDAERCVSVTGRIVKHVHKRIMVMQMFKWGFWSTGGQSVRTRAQDVVWELWNQFWEVLALLDRLGRLCEKAREFYGEDVLGEREGRRLRVDVAAFRKARASIVAVRRAAVLAEEEDDRRVMEEMEKEEEEGKAERADGRVDSGYTSPDSQENSKRRRSETADFDAEAETDEEYYDNKRARIAAE